MSDAAWVAITILIGIFLLMAITVIKSGVEDAIKMWGVMGALTGVAFGAITSYFFTAEIKENEIAVFRNQHDAVQEKLDMSISLAEEAYARIVMVESSQELRFPDTPLAVQQAETAQVESATDEATTQIADASTSLPTFELYTLLPETQVIYHDLETVKVFLNSIIALDEDGN
ncbi:hypothetical protein ACDI10_09830 [Vreelandella venusta]|uniref:hypothetical protein n=1 Tax=Vreelandella venusta TaxID=44935 RepID=UPI003558A2F5